MGWMESLLQFDWLIGVVIGAVLGFGATEMKRLLERGRRRTDVAKLMRNEVAVNREKLVETLNSHKEAAGSGAWTLTSPFRYEAFNSCMPDLPLVGDDALLAIQTLYADLAHLERVPRDALSALTQLYATFRAGREDQDDAAIQEKAINQKIHNWVLEREEETLEATDKALEKLDELIA